MLRPKTARSKLSWINQEYIELVVTALKLTKTRKLTKYKRNAATNRFLPIENRQFAEGKEKLAR